MNVWILAAYTVFVGIDSYIAARAKRKSIDMPNGIDTLLMKTLDKLGFEPSCGEGQKVALMRALYKSVHSAGKAGVVVLDEPTAALDPRADYELYMQFDKLVEGKNAVYISHLAPHVQRAIL